MNEYRKSHHKANENLEQAKKDLDYTYEFDSDTLTFYVMKSIAHSLLAIAEIMTNCVVSVEKVD